MAENKYRKYPNLREFVNDPNMTIEIYRVGDPIGTEICELLEERDILAEKQRKCFTLEQIKEFCDGYDMQAGRYPESEYQGVSVWEFIACAVAEKRGAKIRWKGGILSIEETEGI